MIRVAVRMNSVPAFQVIIYGEDYADIRRQAIKLKKEYKKRDKRKDAFEVIVLDGRHPSD